jgi:hypothetical protein
MFVGGYDDDGAGHFELDYDEWRALGVNFFNLPFCVQWYLLCFLSNGNSYMSIRLTRSSKDCVSSPPFKSVSTNPPHRSSCDTRYL